MWSYNRTMKRKKNFNEKFIGKSVEAISQK